MSSRNTSKTVYSSQGSNPDRLTDPEARLTMRPSRLLHLNEQGNILCLIGSCETNVKSIFDTDPCVSLCLRSSYTFEAATMGESIFLFMVVGVCNRSVLCETNVLKFHSRLTTTASLICSGKLYIFRQTRNRALH